MEELANDNFEAIVLVDVIERVETAIVELNKINHSEEEFFGNQLLIHATVQAFHGKSVPLEFEQPDLVEIVRYAIFNSCEGV